ncbi:MAG: hypothetical protein JWO37_480 [Acidimicrobiales bacterium]|nr:hypothetical protein [Acidimicrobiales bacterium]
MRAESGAAALDLLELELRQLPGVCLVAFDDRETTLVVQLGVEPGTDLVAVRERAGRATGSHLDRPAVVEVVGSDTEPVGGASRRVRLLATIELPDGEIEVHLAMGERRTIGRRRQQDPATAAVDATLDALGAMDLDVPFSVRWVGGLGDGTDKAVAVSLRATDGGGRYGVASGDNQVEAAARATLAALNRFLAR